MIHNCRTWSPVIDAGAVARRITVPPGTAELLKTDICNGPRSSMIDLDPDLTDLIKTTKMKTRIF